MDVRKPLLQCIMIRTEFTGMQLSSFQPNLISSISSILPSFRHSLIQSFLLSFLPSCISSSIHANVHLYSRVPIHSFSDSFFYDLRSFRPLVFVCFCPRWVLFRLSFPVIRRSILDKPLLQQIFRSYVPNSCNFSNLHSSFVPSFLHS